jgi:tRNA threonylcarbamoyladenosine biosynthesis protein TsaE
MGELNSILSDDRFSVQGVSEEEMHKHAKQCAILFVNALQKNASLSFIISLQGTLGMGKTTFARAFIQSMGYLGKVKSPTYSLVERYTAKNIEIAHFDLYRLSDSQELEYIGLDDYIKMANISLIEWAENGQGYFPVYDLTLSINEGEYLNNSRHLMWTAGTLKGTHFLQELSVIDHGAG